MASGELPEKYAIRIHLVDITDVVELNMDVIGNRLVEKKFIASRQLRNIAGPTPASKAASLMRCVEAKIDTSDNKQKWFEKFVLILANDTTADDLVKRLANALVEKKPDYEGVLLNYITKPPEVATGVPASSAPTTTTSPAAHQLPTQTPAGHVAQKRQRSERPDLVTLEKFPHPSRDINIMQEVVPQYKRLGKILLKDPNGVRVLAMEKSHAYNVDDVVYDIFQKWLVEDADATWGKLVQCLTEANLSALDQDIESCLS